jgi:hypothetical protein
MALGTRRSIAGSGSESRRAKGACRRAFVAGYLRGHKAHAAIANSLAKLLDTARQELERDRDAEGVAGHRRVHPPSGDQRGSGAIGS